MQDKSTKRRTRGPRTSLDKADDALRSSASLFEKLPPSRLGDELLKPIRPGHGAILAYEIDMPAPEGLSGAPLVKRPGTEVVGVIYGRVEAGVIDEFASIDPDTGAKTPEVQRIVSFAAAHYTSALHDLTGAATDDKRLADYLGL